MSFQYDNPNRTDGQFFGHLSASVGEQWIAGVNNVAADSKLTHLPEFCWPSPRPGEPLPILGFRQFEVGESKSAPPMGQFGVGGNTE